MGLDIRSQPPQNIAQSGQNAHPVWRDQQSTFMTPSQPSQSPQKKAAPEQCKHPQVQIVSRDEESEYVECKECGEVFESSELKDMAIEEKKAPDEE